MEKLSSGLRINRAGDDAAGLAISEKMRGQIRGLTQASSNAQDGISLIQTAEGALNETHAILQRMRELSVQASSDTNVEADRGEIQKEIDQLAKEIDRIGDTTEFNTMKLVNGERSSDFQVKPAVTQIGDTIKVNKALDQTILVGPDAISGDGKADFDIKISGTADNGFDWGKIDTSETDKNKVVITRDVDGFELDFEGKDTESKTLKINADKIDYNAETDVYSYNNQGISFSFNSGDIEKWDNSEIIELDLNELGGNAKGEHNTIAETVNVDITGTKKENVTVSMDKVTVTQEGALNNVGGFKFKWDASTDVFKVTMLKKDGTTDSDYTTEHSLKSGETLDYNENGIKFSFSATIADATNETVEGKFEFKMAEEKEVTQVEVIKSAVVEDRSLLFQVGANENQKIDLSIGDMRAQALNVDKIDVSSHEKAEASISTINDAIEKVSGERSKLGALQNRLEHTIKNLDTSAENLQASEARIRDVDMAKEMMEQTKQNILAQASTAMLANANQAPQSVLQLLG